MKAGMVCAAACSLALIVFPVVGYLTAAAAQPMPPHVTASDTIAASTQLAQVDTPAPIYAPPQLDQLLAPIALYPDPLLAQILMAATYPLEVVMAARWVQDPNNARLRGDQMDAALQPQDWDPSVKSLVPFPQILQMMNSKLDWTQALGNAFLAQQDDVMASVQRLRAQARAAGSLQSTPQEVVSMQGPTIVIEPANPEVVYVPYYNPTLVYGSWGYPDYPPVYFPPPPNYGYVAGPGIYFGVGFGIIGALWGWDRWDWDRHEIHIDSDRYNRINTYAIAHDNRPRYSENTWQHDPSHRRGVPYSAPAVRQKFQRTVAAPADTRRDFRGFDNRAGAPGANRVAPPIAAARPADVGRPAAAQQPAGRQAPAAAAQRTGEAARSGQARPPEAAPQQPAGRQAPAAAAQRTGEAARGGQARPPAAPTPQTPARTAAAPQQRAPSALGGAQPRPAIQRPVAPAFSSFGKGADVRAQSQRGQTSRQSTPAAAPRAAAPQQHSAPSPQPQRSAPTGGQKGGGNDKRHN
ncbi:MAG TPA: DUF3300 domain-containing protein [Stellaceae bacterium]|nr:DUF3300 domain-containing protein [Stellaceae bacterium]